MESALLLCLGLLLQFVQPGSWQDLHILGSHGDGSRGKVTFIRPQAIFAFGDSLSDTGELSRVAPNIPPDFPPYGETYPGHPTGRFCDGRLVIDWIALAFGLPLLEPYFDSLNASAVGSNFAHGVSFPVAGATARNESLPLSFAVPFNLPVQVDHMLDFAARAKSGSIPFPVPARSSFSKKGLYYIAMGVNDIVDQVLLETPLETITGAIAPQIASNISAAVRRLHKGVGARQFVLWNIPPVGCLPYLLSNASIRNIPWVAYSAETGCFEGINAAAKHTNRLVRAALEEVLDASKNLLIAVADVYTLVYSVQQNPKEYGFTQAFLVCCGGPGAFGYNFNQTLGCGNGNTVLCSDPSEYVIWDGIHNTDAFNKLIATEILNGNIVKVLSHR